MPQNLENIELWRYSLPLREPLTVPNGEAMRTREGLLLVIRKSKELCGIGEIAPLPNLHQETLEDAQTQILSLLNTYNHNFLQVWQHETTLFPSVQCGIEMAEQSLAWLEKPTFLAHLHSVTIPINALISGASTTIVERALRAVQDGYTVLKIKVGRHSLDDDIANIRAIRQHIGNNVELRLDANRTWSLETALELGFAVQDCGISFIEEPLKNWQELEEFTNKTGIQIALDETLYSRNEAEFEARKDIPNDICAAYILKPSALGSIQKSQFLAEEAFERGAKAIVSSVFESGIALRFYAALQALWNGGNAVACGLDTFSFLEDDTINPRFTAQHGKIQCDEMFATEPALNLNFLKRLL